jgi:hypothetical protein
VEGRPLDVKLATITTPRFGRASSVEYGRPEELRTPRTASSGANARFDAIAMTG